MKKLLILLAVAALPAASGCCLCTAVSVLPVQLVQPTGDVLRSGLPADLRRAAGCDLCACTCAPYSPCAPVATAAPYMPAMAQQFMPQCATCPSQPVMTQAQPMYYQAPMANPCSACYAEPGCAYAG